MLSQADKQQIFQSTDDLSATKMSSRAEPPMEWKDCTPEHNMPTKYSSSEPMVYLTETFYITSKKNTVFQVRLTSEGLILRKECNGSTKEQKILLQDIIGCRCLRSKKKTKKNGKASSKCSCALPGPAQLKVVEANSGEQDESDTSAYLYIYAYIPKHSSNANNNNIGDGKHHNRSDKGTTKAPPQSPPASSDENNGRRDRTTVTLRFRSFDKYEDNHQEAQKWRLTIKSLINREVPPFLLQATGSPTMAAAYSQRDTRKTLVILNPKSGSGKARESFQARVAPILTEAEMSYDMYVTKYPNFAREFVRTRDIYTWKSIVVVGGDGIYYEVLNGLCERPDWERALDELPIGIIPCGSGNGLAKTISHLARVRFSIVEATLAIVRQHCVPMDVVRIETKKQIMFSFLSVGWGLLADVDIESEPLRMLGGQRFTIWSVHRLIRLRTYKGRVSYLPAAHVTEDMYKNASFGAGGKQQQQQQRKGSVNGSAGDSKRPSLKHSKSCTAALSGGCGSESKDSGGESEDGVEGGCEACDMMEFGEVLSLETSLSGGGGGGTAYSRSRMDSFYSVGSKRSSYFSMADSVYQDVNDGADSMMGIGQGQTVNGVTSRVPMYGPPPTIPMISEPVPSTWTVMEGEFVMAHTAYQTHLGSDCYFAKRAQLNDGVIWLCVIKGGIPRTQLLQFLLGLSSGTHIPETNHQYIRMIPCTAFRIEPEGSQGYITVDGERVEYGPIQGEVFAGMVNVTVPDV